MIIIVLQIVFGVIVAALAWHSRRELKAVRRDISRLRDMYHAIIADRVRAVDPAMMEGWKKTLAELPANSPKRPLYEKRIAEVENGH